MINIAIVLFDHVDVLDVGGPYEVFLTANRLAERQGGKAPFTVKTVASMPGPVRSYGGLGLVANSNEEDLGELTILIVPGAIAIDHVATDATTVSLLSRLAEKAEIVTSVCTGAFLLGDLGLLRDIAWTTHWEDVPVLAKRISSAQGQTCDWVDAGPVVTSGGLSCGISMALHLVDRLAGQKLATSTARQIDYAWNPEPRGSGQVTG